MASIRPSCPRSWPMIGQDCDTVTGMSGGGGLIKLCDNVANFTVYCNIGGRGSPGKHDWRPSSIVLARGNGDLFSKTFIVWDLSSPLRITCPAILGQGGRRLSTFLTHCLNINLFLRKTWGQTNINYYLRCLFCLSAMDRSYQSLSHLCSFSSFFFCPFWHLTGLNANF